MTETRRAHAPGRVNLIGDHTDYTGGLVFPMAIDRGITIEVAVGGSTVRLTSGAEDLPVEFTLPLDGDPAETRPRWGTYVAAMARELGATIGIRGHVTSTIPSGAGLSSSASLECAVGLALGHEGSAVDLALVAQRAEHAATAVPTGIMDQLCIAAATAGHATLIDCHTRDVTHVAVPDDIEIVVLFVAQRTLVGSAYADRVAECARAERRFGPLRNLVPADLDGVDLDEVAGRRARHVVGENDRVRRFVQAFARGDHTAAGALMVESHASLRDDFETSTPAMDAVVAELVARPGVFGARMTGGGFGGCVVALCEPGALDIGWLVRPALGAHLA